MAVIETLRVAGVLSRFRSGQIAIGQGLEATPQPEFSGTFQQQLTLQRARDTEYSTLIPVGPITHFNFGQDHDVSHLPTDQGRFVLKRLKETSRAYLAFGLGISPQQIPQDNDRNGRRRLAESGKEVTVDPHALAEKVRLIHVMATTYLDGGTSTIWPTGIVVQDGQVHRIQKYIPPFYPNPLVVRDSRDMRVERDAKNRLFVTLEERWRKSLTTLDFQRLPSDVREYWKAYRPDSGLGTNAHFFGIGNVVAIDY